jgi:hypothetical protein
MDRPAEAAGVMQRFYDWFDRQLDRLEPAGRDLAPDIQPGLER